MSVNFKQIIIAGEHRLASVAGEVAGYLILAAADGLLSGPRDISYENILLDERGEVVFGPAAPSDEEECALVLRELLGELLGVARPLPPALFRVIRRSGGGLNELIRELEAALIPVNRAAARRALSRLYREVKQATPALAQLLAAQPGPSRHPMPRTGELDARPARSSASLSSASSRLASRGDNISSGNMIPPPPGRRISSLELTAPQPHVARRRPQQLEGRAIVGGRAEEGWQTHQGAVKLGALVELAEGEMTERMPSVGEEAWAEESPWFSEVVEASERPRQRTPSQPSHRSSAARQAQENDYEEPHLFEGAPSSRQSDVRELLSGFQVAETRTDEELSRALTAMVGVELTPMAGKYG